MILANMISTRILNIAVGKGVKYIQDKIEEAEQMNADGLTKKDKVVSDIMIIATPVVNKITKDAINFSVEAVFQLLKNKTSVK